MTFDLPRDLAEEVLSRVPLTSLRRVRSTCRKWNTLAKDMSFAKKHIAQARLAAAQGKGTMFVMMMDYSVYLMRFNLSNKNNIDESCLKPEAKLIGPDDSDEIDVRQVFHCEGLLLFITLHYTRLVLWNPYLGQTRWIEPTHKPYVLSTSTFALGYDKSINSHKVLRFNNSDFKIYDFNSDSWRVLDVPPRVSRIGYYSGGVSLKGNTYWFVTKTGEYFLICFDFTRETFGTLLRLPFIVSLEDTVILSSVREEQLAVLFQTRYTYKIEIWVTTKIEPDAVSWSSKVFLSANLTRPRWQFQTAMTSFFIDEEKKVAVVLKKDKDRQNTDRFFVCERTQNTDRNIAYIMGVDGSLKKEDVGEFAYSHRKALVCSDVPSLVQLN